MDIAALPLGGHAAKASQAGASAKSQQHCLYLIISMLGNCYGFNSYSRTFHLRQSIKSLISCNAGSIFRALPGNGMGMHCLHMQRNTETTAYASAMGFKVSSRRLQPMIDVNCHHLPRPLPGTSHQQGRRIRATAVGHPQRQSGLKGPHRLVK